MTEMTFEWDPKKAASNVLKHGVTFQEAVTVFSDPLARIHDDPAHSTLERREIISGQSGLGRLLLVAFVERDNRIRIISARRATRAERKDFEKASKP
jgi:uncharacterized DUF497 family protein